MCHDINIQGYKNITVEPIPTIERWHRIGPPSKRLRHRGAKRSKSITLDRREAAGQEGNLHFPPNFWKEIEPKFCLRCMAIWEAIIITSWACAWPCFLWLALLGKLKKIPCDPPDQFNAAVRKLGDRKFRGMKIAQFLVDWLLYSRSRFEDIHLFQTSCHCYQSILVFPLL